MASGFLVDLPENLQVVADILVLDLLPDSLLVQPLLLLLFCLFNRILPDDSVCGEL